MPTYLADVLWEWKLNILYIYICWVISVHHIIIKICKTCYHLHLQKCQSRLIILPLWRVFLILGFVPLALVRKEYIQSSGSVNCFRYFYRVFFWVSTIKIILLQEKMSDNGQILVPEPANFFPLIGEVLWGFFSSSLSSSSCTGWERNSMAHTE